MATIDVPAATIGTSPRARRALQVVAVAIAGLGLALGFQGLLHHLTTDPFVDLRTYYDAGARLNNGERLYEPSAAASTGLYLYPPLLAILFRPLALLPFEAVAPLWLAVSTGALALAVRRAGLRQPVVVALGCLALPIAWSLSIGQVEPLLTLLLALGSPVGVGIATNIKLFPVLVAIYWVARRDVSSLARLAVTIVVLVGFQFALEPEATRTWFEFAWLRPAFVVRTISPYGINPYLWVGFVAALGLVAWRLGRTRHGWAAAVALAVLVHPRLLAYQLTSLLGGFGGPRTTSEGTAQSDQANGAGG